jgi:hypothetical protein
MIIDVVLRSSLWCSVMYGLFRIVPVLGGTVRICTDPYGCLRIFMDLYAYLRIVTDPYGSSRILSGPPPGGFF